MLVDDYGYLEPDDDLTVEEYGEFLKDRFHELSSVAHMYGEFHRNCGPNESGRLAHNWQRYLEAADTVHRVYHELEERGNSISRRGMERRRIGGDTPVFTSLCKMFPKQFV